MMETIACPLCRSDRHEPRLIARDLTLGHEGEFHVVRCVDCGLVYLNPRPAADELGRYYEGGYDNFKYDPSRRPSARQQRKARRKRRLLAAFRGYPVEGARPSKLPNLPAYIAFRLKSKNFIYPEFVPGGRLLDVGCGAGKFLDEMRELGWLVTGVDVSPEAVAACRDRGLDVRQGTLADAGLPDARFDVVTMRHSIEHTPDPAATMLEARRVLKPGGRVTVETPNIAGLPARMFRECWFALEAPRHLVYFSKQTLERLLSDAGFEVGRVRCKSSGFVIAQSFELAAREKNCRLSRLLNRGFICRKGDLLLRMLGMSDELIAFARKP